MNPVAQHLLAPRPAEREGPCGAKCGDPIDIDDAIVKIRNRWWHAECARRKGYALEGEASKESVAETLARIESETQEPARLFDSTEIGAVELGADRFAIRRGEHGKLELVVSVRSGHARAELATAVVSSELRQVRELIDEALGERRSMKEAA